MDSRKETLPPEAYRPLAPGKNIGLLFLLKK